MSDGKVGLTRRQMALAATMGMVKEAQERGAWLSEQGFFTERAVAGAKPVEELLMLYLHLWEWYGAGNKVLLDFVADLRYWTREWLGRREGANLSGDEVNEFFARLDRREEEYLPLRGDGLTDGASRMRFAGRVLVNMGSEADGDALPVTLLSDHIRHFMECIHEVWEYALKHCSYHFRLRRREEPQLTS